MTITVLGSNGKLGTMLTNHARRAGLGWRGQARVAGADIYWSGKFDAVPDGLFNQGGTLINMIGATTSDEEELYGTNVRFVQDLLTKATETKVAHVVLASSAAVYGEGIAPFDESAALNPISPYGISKVAMEHVALTFDAPNAPAITILRIGNVAGADALNKAAQRHVADGTRMPLHRYEDGSFPVRSYIGPQDLFRSVRQLSVPHHGPPHIFNVTHPRPVAMNEMLAAYRTQMWPGLRWVDTPIPTRTPKVVTLAATKVQKIVDFDEYPSLAVAFASQAAEHLAS